MSEERDSLRAGDVDREFVAERLREALNEGRLTLTEYDDRLQETYAARTYGDLKNLLSDLPTVAPTAKSQIVPSSVPTPPSMTQPTQPPPHGLTAQWLAKEWSDWLTLTVILSVIWLIAGGGYYWPIWVVGIIGALKLLQTINGLANGEPRKRYERQQRKEIERNERRAAERDQHRTERDERRAQRDRDRDDQ